MDASQQGRGTTGGHGDADVVPAPIAEAQRLFASLTKQVDRQHPRGRTALDVTPPVCLEVPPGAAEVPSTAEDGRRSQAVSEVLNLVRSTLAATDRIATAVEVVGDQADANRADVAELGHAIIKALVATNDRLAVLERILLGEGGSAADTVEGAIARLRLTVRRFGGSARARRPPPG